MEKRGKKDALLLARRWREDLRKGHIRRLDGERCDVLRLAEHWGVTDLLVEILEAGE